ncbi:hypothetical protein AMTR_s00085p00094510 [Amborella trichopoda]|uniref:Uncharacterized protein n=1 Tax=Amborella trichopoda TaxID=13333 RepID=W1NYL6_AMBTC|nr:hypothetical protein AMTR_s00085p00094510 [Amborella trichopoda]
MASRASSSHPVCVIIPCLTQRPVHVLQHSTTHAPQRPATHTPSACSTVKSAWPSERSLSRHTRLTHT